MAKKKNQPHRQTNITKIETHQTPAEQHEPQTLPQEPENDKPKAEQAKRTLGLE